MSNRHLARTIALQTLFEWDFHHRSKKLFELLKKNQEQFAPEFDDQGFTEQLVKGVTKNLDKIDDLIQKFAPEWPIDQITIIDRNILRLGTFELKYDPTMPPRVAINEAIELAKAFGGESSYRFVNGVLGAIYRDAEASGDICGDNSLKQRDKNSTDVKQAVMEPQEISVGGVVYRKEGSKYYIALIKDAIDKWTFPKGKIGDNIKDETIESALTRELNEEIGLTNQKIIAPIGSIDVTVHPPGLPPYPKRIYYYLVETTQQHLRGEDSVTVKDARWFPSDEAMQVLSYENSKEILKDAIKKIDELNK